MDETTTQQVEPQAPSATVTASHFWATSTPHLRTSVLIAPPPLGTEHRSHLKIFDSGGNLCNEIDVTFPAGQTGCVELAPLLNGVRLESGMLHGHVEVASEFTTKHALQYFDRGAFGVVESMAELSADHGVFFPLTVSDERLHLLAFTNGGSEVAQVRCRFFIGSRMPEVVYTLQGNGSGVICIEEEFAEYIPLLEGKEIQAYTRLTTKGAQVGVQLIERHVVQSGDERYAILT